MHLPKDICKTRVVDNIRHRITYFFHHQANAAGFFILAFVAWNIGRLADAGNRRQRPIQHANYASKLNGFWLSPKKIPAAFAFLALQDTVILEFEEDQL